MDACIKLTQHMVYVQTKALSVLLYSCFFMLPTRSGIASRVTDSWKMCLQKPFLATMRTQLRIHYSCWRELLFFYSIKHIATYTNFETTATNNFTIHQRLGQGTMKVLNVQNVCASFNSLGSLRIHCPWSVRSVGTLLLRLNLIILYSMER